MQVALLPAARGKARRRRAALHTSLKWLTNLAVRFCSSYYEMATKLIYAQVINLMSNTLKKRQFILGIHTIWIVCKPQFCGGGPVTEWLRISRTGSGRTATRPPGATCRGKSRSRPWQRYSSNACCTASCQEFIPGSDAPWHGCWGPGTPETENIGRLLELFGHPSPP